MKRKILLFGPKLSAADRAYGGGTGGFTRNMSAYLNYFKSDTFEIEPSFHTIRGGSKLDFFVIRFFRDAFTFFKDISTQKPKGVHILAQYRTAIPREFMVVFLSKLFSVPVLYEVKAGSFMAWFEQTNVIFKTMTKYVLRNSNVVLSEGIPYLNYLKENFNVDAHYFPNYVPSAEVPQKVGAKLSERKIKVLFVGYAYKAKGVYELVEGCNLAAKNIPIELTLIGKESDKFKTWLDEQKLESNLTINRLGVKPHDEVLEWFDKIDKNREVSKNKAEASRAYLIDNFTSEVAYKKLNNHYKVLTAE